ncbi:AraC family transcriptional regulator [Roseibium sp. SCP14]|uniref:AraC family transcriptional regulator n=1 Tax=Roseibium sp. SCP14 TaxID=3141375 RepID=UPI003339DB65
MQPKTIGAVAASMVSYALSRGVPLPEIFEKLNIDPMKLLEPGAKLPEDEFPKIMNLMASSLPGEAFPLDLAKVTPLSVFGFVSSALEFAPTVRDALEMLVRYRSALSDRVLFTLVDSEKRTSFQMYHPMDALDGGATAEFGCALLYRVMKEWFDANKLVTRIEFAHKPRVAQSHYEEFFETEVLFNQPSNGLVLAHEALDRPNRLPSKPLYEYARAHLERLSNEEGSAVFGSEQLRKVHDAICENAAVGEYSAVALAKKLSMSLRSLQRLVSQNGGELREMLENVREANAKKLLANRDLSLSNIAHLLGYSEERAFRRSFKRWSDLTPSQFRDSL